MKYLILVIALQALYQVPQCTAQNSSVEQKIATSATKLSQSDLSVFDSNKNYLQVTVTDGFGYSEHLVVGETKIDGQFVKCAFFQKYSYNPESKSLHVIRRSVRFNKDWNDIRVLLTEQRLESIHKSLFEEYIALDAGSISIKVRVDQNDFSFTKYSPNFSGPLFALVNELETLLEIRFTR